MNDIKNDMMIDAFVSLYEIPTDQRREAVAKLLWVHTQYIAAVMYKEMKENAVKVSDWLVEM